MFWVSKVRACVCFDFFRVGESGLSVGGGTLCCLQASRAEQRDAGTANQTPGQVKHIEACMRAHGRARSNCGFLTGSRLA